MYSKTYLLIFLLVAILASVFLWSAGGNRIKDEAPYYIKDALKQTATVTIDGVNIEAEVARTPAARAKGLSGRAYLAPGRGMLFVFDQPGEYTFSMADMAISLDIIWIHEGMITGLTERAQPGAQTIDPAAPATYVLEVSAGTAADHGWQIGDEVGISFDK